MEEADQRTVPPLRQAFGVVPGLSDHTPGTACAVAAVALGARVIEKHFTLSRADGGPDSAFSLSSGTPAPHPGHSPTSAPAPSQEIPEADEVVKRPPFDWLGPWAGERRVNLTGG